MGMLYVREKGEDNKVLMGTKQDTIEGFVPGQYVVVL